jgi:hypothetical protein
MKCIIMLYLIKGKYIFYRMASVPLLTLEMDCDQIAIGLPPVTSAVFLIAKSF